MEDENENEYYSDENNSKISSNKLHPKL